MTKVIGKKHFFFHGLWQMEQDKPPQFQRERERESISAMSLTSINGVMYRKHM